MIRFNKLPLSKLKVAKLPIAVALLGCLTMLNAQRLTAQTVTHTVLFDVSFADASVNVIEVDLFGVDAPNTVANFLAYVNEAPGSNYDGSIIHRSSRVASSGVEVIQGGGFYGNAGFTSVPAMAPIANEALVPTPISNTRGTIAMARLGGDPDSATNQWFFNVFDNVALDTIDGGFTVFGEVTSGLNVVDAISGLTRFNATTTNPAFAEIPLINGNTPVVLNSITVVQAVPEPGALTWIAFCSLGLAVRRRR